METFIERAKSVSVFGAGGFLSGFIVGGSSAIVNSKSFLPYSIRTGVNCAVVGSCVGGINEGLALARGTRDPLNPAIACAVSGFLAAVQRATPKRAAVVGLVCAGAGVAGHYGWEEATQRFETMKRSRREELGLAPEETPLLLQNDQNRAKPNTEEEERKQENMKEFFKWSPVRPITEAEIEERRRIDRLRR
jgi:hypothetical protein